MSEKISSGREAKNGVDSNLPQNRPACTDSPTLVGASPVSASTRLPLEVTLPINRRVDSLSGSPIVFSNMLKSMDGRELRHENNRSVGNSHDSRIESWEDGTKVSRHEWVEQYEPGVYITFTILPGGQKGLKRVRFR